MKPILIAGGGIGGIATALCLRENQQNYPCGFPEGQQRIYGYDADAALAGAPA